MRFISASFREQPSPCELKVNGRVLTTKNIVVATGARPLVPTIPGLDLVHALTSENIWQIRDLPKRLIVLGGGPIGCELAQSFARLGSEVTLVEMSNRILARGDEDVSAAVMKSFLKQGLKILTSYKVVEKPTFQGLVSKNLASSFRRAEPSPLTNSCRQQIFQTSKFVEM